MKRLLAVILTAGLLVGCSQDDGLITAVTALDAVWDRTIFDHANSFGGPEVGDARTLSAAILARLIEVEYVALASAAGGSIPPSGVSLI